MAAEHLKTKYEKSDKQKFMEHHFSNALGGPESIMKFSPQRLESPPPKPPRRRYSDQLSISSLGTYTSKKSNEENQKNDLKINRCSPKPAYLSLPANLTSNVQAECNDSSKLHSYSHNLTEKLKNSKQDEFYVKHFLDNLQISDSFVKQTCENRFYNKEKSQERKPDHVVSKYQNESLVPCIEDKCSTNSLCKNKVYMTNTIVNQNLKSFHKECHRRHHSDPAISYCNLQNDNSLKFNYNYHCDGIPVSSKILNKYCDSAGCPCCKKSYLILQEIQILKEINEKLWQHLCSLQTCIESMKKNVYEDCTDVSVSGLLSSIYYAQKAKDIAMERRLNITLEERNVAIRELEDLIGILTKSHDYPDGEKEDTEKLLDELRSSMNPSKFLKYQRLLLEQLHKESRQDCLSLKLKHAKVERDNALGKVRKLEEEIKELKHSYGLWQSDNKHWEFTMLDILSHVMHQRDTVLSKVDNGLDICSAKYRQSVTSKLAPVEHQNISSKYESRSQTTESLKSHQTVHLIDYKQQHSMSTSEEVTKLKEEILILNKALEGEMKKREQSEEKSLRLERLVHILRKKLNGQNIGVPV